VCWYVTGVAVVMVYILNFKTLMNVWSPMEDVNMFVRALMVAIHAHVMLDIR